MLDLLASQIRPWRIRFSVSSLPFLKWRELWRQCVCGYRGHLVQLRRQPDRVWLTCAACHYESPGIELQTWRVRMAWVRSKHELWRLRIQQRRVSA